LIVQCRKKAGGVTNILEFVQQAMNMPRDWSWAA